MLEGCVHRARIDERAGRNVRKIDLWENSGVLPFAITYLLDTQIEM